MKNMMNEKMYDADRMDAEIDNDVAELRALFGTLPEPAEPHPAYWNNFLLRVHEKIEAEASPRRSAWWSPALIWGSLTGTTALLVLAMMTGVFPFGGDKPDDNAIAALKDQPTQTIVEEDSPVEVPAFDEVTIPVEEVGLTARPAEKQEVDPVTYATDTQVEVTEASYSIVLTEEDIDMMTAIEEDDDDAILQAMLDDESLEI